MEFDSWSTRGVLQQASFGGFFGEKWSGRKDLNLRPLGPEPRCNPANSY
jgi:hypothetical protein